MDKPNESSESEANASISANSGSAELPSTAAAADNGPANECEVGTASFEDMVPFAGQVKSNSPDKDKRLGCGSSSAPIKSETKAIESGASATPAAVTSGNIISTSSSIAAAMATRAAYLIPLRATTNVSLPVGVAAATLHHASSPHAAPLPPINLNISTTTGGNFGVTVDPQISVENLKKIIAKKLKVAKDRICLLHRDKELQDGTLKFNNLVDGSKIILIPNVETGLLAQRPENTVMQALESLNDSQVNDFLSGKTPLNLSMRLGDHMMLIQLQLSTVNPANAANSATSNNSSSTCNLNATSSARARASQRTIRATLPTSTSSTSAPVINRHHHYHHHHHHHPATTSSGNVSDPSCSPISDASDQQRSDLSASSNQPSTLYSTNDCNTPSTSKSATKMNTSVKNSNLSSLLSKHDYENLENIVRSITKVQPTGSTSTPITISQQKCSPDTDTTEKTVTQITKPTAALLTAHTDVKNTMTLLEQSPIKSLSNLVSSSIKTTALNNISTGKSSGNSCPSAICAATCQDPITAKLTSCLCTRLNTHVNNTLIDKISSKDLNFCRTVKLSETMPPEVSLPAVTASQMMAETAQTTSQRNPNNLSTAAASMLHKTVNNPIARSKHRHHHHHHYHHHYHYHQQQQQDGANKSSITRLKPTSEVTSISECFEAGRIVEAASSHRSLQAEPVTTASGGDSHNSGSALSDTRTLAEASRNLTQTLRKLSREVFTNKMDLAHGDDTARKGNTGAVIESMKNHGKGIYSGTFSGTLNPALQDRFGRPKRDISTVIHILNDLLSATPQYSRNARIRFETPSTATTTAGTSQKCAMIQDMRSKQKLSIKHCVKCLKTKKPIEAQGNNSSDSTNKIKLNSQYCNECAKYSVTSNIGGQRKSQTGGNSSGTTESCTECTCRYRHNTESGDQEVEQMCQKCSVELENMKMKSKIDQLRLVMQQSKQKREARKLKGAPYATRSVGATTATAATVTTATRNTNSNTLATAVATAPSTHSTSTSLVNSNNNTASSEVSPNHIVEEVDTAA